MAEIEAFDAENPLAAGCEGFTGRLELPDSASVIIPLL
mgnify:CR=1 FL=1